VTGLRALGRSYLEKPTFHVNANILCASLLGTAATAMVSATLRRAGWGASSVAGIGTATNAVVFVPVQLALHYLVVRVQARRRGEADVAARYWRESRWIWATGLPAIATFLTLFTFGQAAMLRLGLAAVPATITAYVAAQLLGRLVHTLLLRFTAMGKPAPADAPRAQLSGQA
jgi:hypothetical protein